MSLKDTLNDTLKSTMKAKNLEQVKVLRNLQAAIKKVEIDERIELDDSAILQIIQKQLKMRQESLGIFSANGRDDLAQKEQFEIDVISQFLPKQLSEEELNTLIKQTISDIGATDIKEMGKVINAIKAQTAGQADPAVISGLVKKALSA